MRDLVDVLMEPLVKESDFVYSNFITTLIAIVPKDKVALWLNTYESLHDNVIPGSAKQF